MKVLKIILTDSLWIKVSQFIPGSIKVCGPPVTLAPREIISYYKVAFTMFLIWDSCSELGNSKVFLLIFMLLSKYLLLFQFLHGTLSRSEVTCQMPHTNQTPNRIAWCSMLVCEGASSETLLFCLREAPHPVSTHVRLWMALSELNG